jgi:tetratricopeptide (TPR) repeat protein
MRKTALVAILVAAFATGIAHAKRDAPAQAPSAGCGTFDYARERIGPLDYRTIDPKTLRLIEDYHFSRKVEMLREGETGNLGRDLAYTLNAIPNHPRALRTMAEFFKRNNLQATRDTGFGLQCWFDRALAFRPDDPMVRILVANELMKSGKRQEAAEHLAAAEKHAGNSSMIHYNLGLLYLDLKDYDNSVEHARKAYQLGAALPGLKNMLAEAGKWRE